MKTTMYARVSTKDGRQEEDVNTSALLWKKMWNTCLDGREKSSLFHLSTLIGF